MARGLLSARIGTKGSSVLRQFGQLESTVMQRLWEWQRPAAVREVLEDFQKTRTIAYTTVMTVMDNLFRKGLLEREIHGRAYLYQPIGTREQHTAELMEQVLSNGGDSGATLLHLVEQIPVEDVEQLRTILDRRASDGKNAIR